MFNKDARGKRLLSGQIHAFAKAKVLTRVILKALPLPFLYRIGMTNIFKAQCIGFVQHGNGNN